LRISIFYSMNTDFLLNLIAKNKTAFKLGSYFVDFVFSDSIKTYRIIFGPARGIIMKLSARKQTSFLLGIYESAAVNLLLKHLSDETVFWDIGAHTGYFTCIMSPRLTEGRVICVEPLSENIELLRENIRLNNLKNTIIIDKALSSSEKIVSFLVAKDSYQGKIAHNQEYLPGKKVYIKATTIDALIKSGIPVPNILKIDAEGEEGRILKGATLVLQKYQPCFLIEIHSSENAQICWDILSFYRYNIKFLNNGFLQQAERPQDIENRHIWAEVIK